MNNYNREYRINTTTIATSTTTFTATTTAATTTTSDQLPPLPLVYHCYKYAIAITTSP